MRIMVNVIATLFGGIHAVQQVQGAKYVGGDDGRNEKETHFHGGVKQNAGKNHR